MAKVEVNGWLLAIVAVVLFVPLAIFISVQERRHRNLREAEMAQMIADIDEEYSKDRMTCRFIMWEIAMAEFTYHGKTKKDFTADLSALDLDVEGGVSCPMDGKYSVTVNEPLGSFTVHCSYQPHDQSNDVWAPNGYSPGLNDR